MKLTFRVVLYIVGVVGEVLMLTSLYLFMPAVRVRFLHALIGGITATILWEITRRGLIWYYSTLSLVNVIYGSFATPVVALLTAEAIALIVLLGAQVIAELEGEPSESRRFVCIFVRFAARRMQVSCGQETFTK